MTAAPSDPEFESWADVDDDDHGVHVVQPAVDAIISEPDFEPEFKPEPEPDFEPDPEPDFEPDPEPAAEAVEDVLIPEAIAHFDPGPPNDGVEEDDDSAAVTPADVPLPTLTLAKLALEQGDEGLAVATLERLIEHDPSDAAAGEMLHELRSGQGRDSTDVTSAKVAALRGWLDTIRLASERR